MLDAEHQKSENEQRFEDVKRAYLADLKARFGMTDMQLTQTETLVNWAFDVGFHSGRTFSRQTDFNERMKEARKPATAGRNSIPS